ncbi:MAG: sigma-70 family RNA polymerase sigma factor [Candidatus Zixiibacteriota bacterium]
MTPDSPEESDHGGQRDAEPCLDPGRWLEQYGDLLYSVAYLRLHDRAAAEDALQETLLAAWRSRHRFAGLSSEKTWLVGILKRKIVDQLRRKFRECPLEDPPDGEDIEDAGYYPSGRWKGHWIPDEGPAEWGDNPDAILERRELRETLEQCLASLPARLSTVFVLYEMEDMPAEDICRELGITPTNLWVMLHRARKKLRLCLEQRWFGGDAGR